ncbi:hypothetical protein LLEC1_00585 [Akanthomyces lecanii]|uniref:Uncharacterized protein n=1 Tax=Cordyceps confragosa TaxID=2714763 RepID=A0A179I8E4_CORDF|nr:hypothetical protein LLEC1_00585 [Akanthomyces lecanii]
MRTFAVLATILAAGSAVFAAPATPAEKRENNSGGFPGGASGQNLAAAVFKAGDEFLNIPGDFFRKIFEGNAAGAGAGLVQNIGKAGSDLPKDAMGVIAPPTN